MRELRARVALVRLGRRQDRLDHELGDQRTHPIIDGSLEDRVDPDVPTRGRPGTARFGDGIPNFAVSKVGKGQRVELVERRPEQRGPLHGNLQCLALDLERRVPRIRPRRRRTATVPTTRRPGNATNPLKDPELVGGAHPPGEPARVLVPQRGVLDRRNEGHRALKCGHSPLGYLQVEPREHAADGELEQRLAAGDQIADRGITLGDPQFARVHVVGTDRDERVRDELLVTLEGAQGRLLARGVAVEREDHLAGVLRRIEQQPAEHPNVLVAECGAAGGNRCGDAREVARHDIGVALDHHGLPGLRHLPPGQVDAVEHLALLVQGTLGRIQVFRPVVVRAKLACAESHHVARDVADGPDQPPAEPVDDAALAAAGQPAGGQLLVGEPATAQVLDEVLPTVGRVADAEVGRRSRIEPALGQERPAHNGLSAGQLLREVLSRRLVRLDQA